MKEKIMKFIERWIDIDEPNWRNDDQLIVEPDISSDKRNTRFYGGEPKWRIRSIVRCIKYSDCKKENYNCEGFCLSLQERLTHPIIDMQITEQLIMELEKNIMEMTVSTIKARMMIRGVIYDSS